MIDAAPPPGFGKSRLRMQAWQERGLMAKSNEVHAHVKPLTRRLHALTGLGAAV